MRAAIAIAAAAALAACSGSPGPGDDDVDVDAADPTGDGGSASPDAAGGGPDGAGGGAALVLYQCTPFDGGLCTMRGDGGDPRTLHDAGFAPRGQPDGSILFHTAAYQVARRSSGGAIDELGEGAFPRRQPDGRILFQCSGLNGGLCRMDADGSNRSTLRATGRVPNIDADGVILLHTDAYRVVRREPGGQETDLGDGAFPVWTDDGRILFQCSGLGGGLCRMDAAGSNRTTLENAGRVPASGADGILFHSDAYTVSLRTGSGITPLRPGANAVWWPQP